MPCFSSNAKSAEGRLPTETLYYRKKTGRFLAHVERFVEKTGRGFLGQIERQQKPKKSTVYGYESIEKKTGIRPTVN